MKFIDKINVILSEDASSFADSFGVPSISSWIISQYNKGHRSHKDYEDIINWVSDRHPNIDEYDFHNALKQAKIYCQSLRKDGFDPYVELHSNNVVQEFDDGKEWLQIGPEDCNAVCHRLRYDCSRELSTVKSGEANCYLLQDPQGNTLCAFIDCEPNSIIIGQFGKAVTDSSKEIKSLCVRMGINLIPEAYNDIELAKALATKELNIDDVSDITSVMRRLSAKDIINCDLIYYAHHAPIKTIYDLYNRTGHSCLIKYCLCYLVANGKTSTSAYQTIKAAAMRDNEISSMIRNNKGSDTRFYQEKMDEAISDIINLTT